MARETKEFLVRLDLSIMATSASVALAILETRLRTGIKQDDTVILYSSPFVDPDVVKVHESNVKEGSIHRRGRARG